MRRVYILPSTAGFCFALSLFIMLVGAMNYNNNLGMALVFLLIGVGLQTTLQTWRNLRGLVLRARAPKAVFAGQQLQFPVQLENSGREWRRALVLSLAGPDSRREYCVQELAGGRSRRLFLDCAAPRRGLCRLQRVRLDTLFPLGLLRAWALLDFEVQGIVYPRASGTTTLPPCGTLTGTAAGQQQFGVDDFAGLNKYRPGDRLSTIAWKTLARGGPLMVKHFTGEGARSLLFEWQHVAHLGNTEQRLSQLCLWIIQASASGMQYGLRIPGVNISLGDGRVHLDQCLTALALFPADGSGAPGQQQTVEPEEYRAA